MNGCAEFKKNHLAYQLAELNELYGHKKTIWSQIQTLVASVKGVISN
jgi:hypothetical protein